MSETRLQLEIRKRVAEALASDEAIDNLYREIIQEIEKPMFDAVLISTRGNQTAASRTLGVNRGHFRGKLKKHGMMK